MKAVKNELNVFQIVKLLKVDFFVIYALENAALSLTCNLLVSFLGQQIIDRTLFLNALTKEIKNNS